MKRRPALPVVLQVAALAVFAVVMGQAVALTMVVLAPPPPPAGFSIEAAAEALAGRPAKTADGRKLVRRISSKPVTASGEMQLLNGVIATGLSRRLALQPGQVVVAMRPTSLVGGLGSGGRGARPPVATSVTTTGIAPRVTTNLTTPPSPGQARAQTIYIRPMTPEVDFSADPKARRLTFLADGLTFAPFSASARLPDGRWATVEPPRGLLSPWQQRLLIAFAISMLLLAPLVWWMARRLTRPIRVFADAAARLGDDPDAEPLKPFGPTEVRTAIDAFNDMQASLRGHVRRRTQTVAAIAHDLRTPLTRLRFRAEQAPDAVRDRMNGDIDEMDALIGQAMAYVRGESPPERRERLDLSSLVGDCAEGFAETGANVTVSAPDPLPVDGDPASLRRALTNLIDNALKFTEAARVRAFAEHGRAVVLIEDDGPGLPDEELEAVFEPFQRGERSRNRETGGAGLGLTVARQAARAHGGEATLANRPNGGLTARLSLPLAP